MLDYITKTYSFVYSKPSIGHLNFLCNDSRPRAYLPYFSKAQLLSAVRQPINLFVVGGIGLGEGLTVTSSLTGLELMFKGDRTPESKPPDDRFGPSDGVY